MKVPNIAFFSKPPARRLPRCRGLRGCTQKCGFAKQGDGSVLSYMTEAARAKRIHAPTPQALLNLLARIKRAITIPQKCGFAKQGDGSVLSYMTEAARAKRIYTPTPQALLNLLARIERANTTPYFSENPSGRNHRAL